MTNIMCVRLDATYKDILTKIQKKIVVVIGE